MKLLILLLLLTALGCQKSTTTPYSATPSSVDTISPLAGAWTVYDSVDVDSSNGTPLFKIRSTHTSVIFDSGYYNPGGGFKKQYWMSNFWGNGEVQPIFHMGWADTIQFLNNGLVPYQGKMVYLFESSSNRFTNANNHKIAESAGKNQTLYRYTIRFTKQ